MGANGSKGKGLLEDPNMRQYHTVMSISDNIKVVAPNKKNANIKLPEESHTANRIYVAINKPAKDCKGQNDPYAGKLKSIAVYGSDCKKLYEIHVDHKHDGMQIHYHKWIDGKPERSGTGKNAHNVAHKLTPDMEKLLNKIYKKVPHV